MNNKPFRYVTTPEQLSVLFFHAHRILPDDENAICSYIKEQIAFQASDSPELHQWKEDALLFYDEIYHLAAIKGVWRFTPRIHKRRLTYEVLPELSWRTGIPLRELIDSTSDTPLDWSNETERQMAELCDYSSREVQYAVLSLLEKLSSDRIGEIVSRPDTKGAAQRIFRGFRIYEQTSRQSISKIAELGFAEQYEVSLTNVQSVSGQNAVPLNMLAKACISFDCSPHWALGLDGCTTLLCRNGVTERIMDFFCLLPDFYQQVIISTCMRYVKGDNYDHEE